MSAVTSQRERWFGLDLPREIAPGIHWLGGCLEAELNGDTVHSHVSAFLVLGTTKSLLVDTGHPKDWSAVTRQLDETLAGRSLDYIFPTHPELPHSGNLRRLLQRYPEAVACGDMRDYHLYYPDIVGRMVEMTVGESIDMGDTEFVFVPAVVRDLPNTLWGFDRARRMLFVADAFGYAHYHGSGECALAAEELTKPPHPNLVAFINDAALYWTRYSDVEEAVAGIAALQQDYPTDIVAPAHGSVLYEPKGVTAEVIMDGYRTASTRRLIEGERREP